MIYPRFPGMWVFTEIRNAGLPTALAIYWDNVLGIFCSLGQFLAAGALSGLTAGSAQCSSGPDPDQWPHDYYFRHGQMDLLVRQIKRLTC